MGTSAAGNDLFDLADACQKKADDIAARLADPLDAATINELIAAEGNLRVSANKLRMQGIDAVVQAGTSAREQLDRAARDAKTAIETIHQVEDIVALAGAIFRLAGEIVLGDPPGILAAASNLSTVARPLIAPPGAST
jgi:NhaP-type Na+/H+ or K+/H+ antiporter